MDKIREEFEKYKFRDEHYVIFQAGFKVANLLPTEKVCPECGGEGTIQIYYTPEQFKAITGKDYPDYAICWYQCGGIVSWEMGFYKWIKKYSNPLIVIVQTAQPAPAADYRPEDV